MRLKVTSGYTFLGVASLPLAGTLVLGLLNLKGTLWTLAPLAGFTAVFLCMVLIGGRSLRQLAQKDEWTRDGRCARCGYDLAGLEGEESCPECGTHRPQ